MQSHNLLNEIAGAAGLTDAQTAEFLRSEPLQHALRLFTDRVRSARANNHVGITTVVSAIEFRAYPATGEDGNKYVSYRCAICGARAHVYALKRVRGARPETPADRQMSLDCEGKP